MNRLDSPRSGAAQRGCQAEQGPGGKAEGWAGRKVGVWEGRNPHVLLVGV